MTVDGDDYTLRIDWRAAGDSEMPQWTITCTDPSGINLNQYLNETNDETDLLTAVQAYLTALWILRRRTLRHWWMSLW